MGNTVNIIDRFDISELSVIAKCTH